MLYIIQEAFRGLGQNKSMSFITIGIISISIFIFGIFVLGTANLLKVISVAEERVEMIVYLNDSVSERDLNILQQQISTILGVQGTEYISKETALEQFKTDLKENTDLLSAFETNPLPASIKVYISMAYKTPEYMKEISQKVALFSGVDDIDYGAEWIEDLDRVIKILFVVDLVLGILIALASVFIVFNTIRLTVYARRDQLDIMDLVGATEMYLELPYIAEGVFHGLAGSMISTLLLYFLFSFISSKVPGLIFLNTALVWVMIIFGMLLGLVGSYMSVKQCMGEIREVKRKEFIRPVKKK